MKTSLCVLALLCLGTAVVQAAPVAEPVAAPVVAEPIAEHNGLRVSISSHRKGFSADNKIGLGTSNPNISVVLQNTTSELINVPDEWNSWGNYCLTLEISKVNGRVLEKPLVVRRTEGTWFANGRFVEVIDANEAIARSIPLFVPDEVIRSSTVQVSQVRGRSNSLYYGFPFPNSSAPVSLTMRVVFSNDFPEASKDKSSWNGKIASPWKDYLVSW